MIYSCSRALELIGEAVKKIPSNITSEYPLIQWSDIAKMRDILIHYYYGADEKIIWDACKKDIPSLKKVIIEIMNRTIQAIDNPELQKVLLDRVQSINNKI